MPILGIIDAQKISHLSAGSYDALATVTVPSGGASTITFAGIPAGYRYLEMATINLSSSANNGIVARFNGDTSTNYSIHGTDANGAGGTPTAYSAASAGYNYFGYTGTAGYPATSLVRIYDYAATDKAKTSFVISGSDSNATATAYVATISGSWFKNSSGVYEAINTITLTHGASVAFNQHSHFALYGVK